VLVNRKCTQAAVGADMGWRLTADGDMAADAHGLPGTGKDAVSKLEQPRSPWYYPELYRRIVEAALSGARAMARHSNGTLVTVHSAVVCLGSVRVAEHRHPPAKYLGEVFGASTDSNETRCLYSLFGGAGTPSERA
jgi:hypothetical protein